MHRENGFTLIELLLVIAIIVLLLAILMPAMARVRKQSRTVVCMANLNQWGLIFTMYTDDNNGLFQKGWVGRKDGSLWWMDAARLYYKVGDFRCCPEATKPYSEGGRTPFGAWGIDFRHISNQRRFRQLQDKRVGRNSEHHRRRGVIERELFEAMEDAAGQGRR